MLLVFTFIKIKYEYLEDNENCKLVSVSIGNVINNKFVLYKQMEIPNYMTLVNYYTSKLKPLEQHLNDQWNNKGLMLLDSRSDSTITEAFNKFLIKIHKDFGNDVKRIVCGVASNEEYENWKKTQKEYV